MPLSEVEAHMVMSDIRRRNFIVEQLGLKKQILAELKNAEAQSPLRESQLRDALEIISDNLQRLRVEGIV